MSNEEGSKIKKQIKNRYKKYREMEKEKLIEELIDRDFPDEEEEEEEEEEEIEEEEEEEEVKYECTDCGALIIKDQPECGECGAALEWEDEDENEEEAIMCKSCNVELTEEEILPNNICPYCNESVHGESNPEKKTKPLKKK